jgi:hypothetical protein
LRASQESFGTFLQQQQSLSHGFFRQHLQDQGQQFLVTQQHNLEKFVSYLQLHNGVVSDITTHQAVLDNMQKVLISLLTKQPALTDENPGAGVLSRRLASTAAAPTFTSQLRQPADTEDNLRAALLRSSPSFPDSGSSSAFSVPGNSISTPAGQTQGARRQLMSDPGAAASAAGGALNPELPVSGAPALLNPEDMAAYLSWRATQGHK